MSRAGHDARAPPSWHGSRPRPYRRLVLGAGLSLHVYLSDRYNPSMDAMEVLLKLSRLTSAQWGLVTTAQAARLGVSRLYLSRLADAGHLERLGHGVYQAAGVPADRLQALKAAWLSITPKLTAEEQLRQPAPDAVVFGATAAFLHGLGDLVPEPYEFTVPTRRQTQRPEIRFRLRRLPAESVTVREGLPVTTAEQTIADLVEARTDRSLVADVLADARGIDRARLADLLAPLAARNGFASGAALRDHLEHLRSPARQEA